VTPGGAGGFFSEWTRRSGRRGSVIATGRSRIASGERQSAEVMQLGIHTCFRTALASHRELCFAGSAGKRAAPLVCADGEGRRHRRVAGVTHRLAAGEEQGTRGFELRSRFQCLTQLLGGRPPERSSQYRPLHRGSRETLLDGCAGFSADDGWLAAPPPPIGARGRAVISAGVWRPRHMPVHEPSAALQPGGRHCLDPASARADR
jgi:hypothetical protein